MKTCVVTGSTLYFLCWYPIDKHFLRTDNVSTLFTSMQDESFFAMNIMLMYVGM
jgi:hypothetical protein